MEFSLIQLIKKQSAINIRMGQIDFTNIVVDDFRKGKWNPFNKYIYILTHIHSDHLRGLNNSWNYGPIYCSRITATLIINKFNNLKSLIKIVPYEEPYVIKLCDELEATITFFDANHCGGAVVVLLEGYFGRFLYTGDFRFNKQIFSSYSYLYPPQQVNPQFINCSKPIDKMWLDNTFCNPRFNFPPRDDAFKLLEEFVKENLGKRVYIGMDHYGKEEALVHLAKFFETIIVVDEQRYETIIAMEFDREFFTTNPSQGLLQVVPKRRMHEKMQENSQSLGLVMSGWCNVPYWSKDHRVYHVPYSLHSNYKQMLAFVKSVKPSMIEPIVPLEEAKKYDENSISITEQYSTDGNADAFRKLVKENTSPISAFFKKNQNDEQFLQVLKQKFGFDRKSVNQTKISSANSNSFTLPPKGKGYKIQNERNQEEIERVKRYLREKKKIDRHQIKQIIVNEDESEQVVDLVEIDDQIFEEQEEPDRFEELEEGPIKPKNIRKRQKQIKKYQEINLNDFKTVKFITGKQKSIAYFYNQVKNDLLDLHRSQIKLK